MISVNKDIFVKRLNDAMANKRFSQADLTQACQPYANTHGLKIFKQKISKWCTGASLPQDYSMLEMLGAALEVHPNYFLGMDVVEGLTDEEQNIVRAWRNATDYERETIRLVLRRYLHENAF